MSERDGGEIINSITTKEGQVAMDFTGKSGKVITNTKEIQKLANTRNKVVSNELCGRKFLTSLSAKE